MTTNRVDKLDQTLESRINIAVELPDIDFEEQKAIWRNWIRRLVSPNSTQKEKLEDFVDFELEKAEESVYTKMNGRQIRNCITAASALARKDNGMSTRTPSIYTPYPITICLVAIFFTRPNKLRPNVC
jgi:ATP-dependent 26S proteasome regulatory subunit